MNKLSVILIAFFSLILISSVVLAEESNENETDESENETDLDLSDSDELEEAQETELNKDELKEIKIKNKPFIRTLFFSGSGIASNPSDAMDFFIVKVVGAKVALNDGNIVGKGLLYLDRNKYRLTDLVVEGDQATAKIVFVADENSVDSNNSTSIISGELAVTKVAKPTADVWAGTMTLNGTKYNFYLLVQKREFNKEEVSEKAKNYCKEHPYDENCKSVAGYLCKDNPEDCRLKVERYCEDHSDDFRCKNIVRSYCAGNLRDARCRAEIQNYCGEFPDSQYCKSEIVEFCKENPEDEKCQTVFTEYCSEHPNESRCKATERAFCKENPDDEKCLEIAKHFCEYNQDSAECAVVQIDFCKENPDSIKCQATATALCSLTEYQDSERCNAVITQAKERVKEAVENKLRITERIGDTVNTAR
ncbi:MAG: hypothetical protein COX63_01375 [Candidatus Diapherotrites archaeon CG_4_10_14_0_2_um_filter_31_5]|nr:MAG: hypothetical protein COX63_01375 [Candidatus Diapherotrites archaeon CG_4_10_14_0_2_um_filter_31_5]